MHQLFSMRGKEQDTVDEVAAGDIAAVAKLAAHRHRRRARAPRARRSPSTVLPAPEPLLAVAIRAKSKGDEDKLANALHRLQEEDPVLRIERNAETHQTRAARHGRDAPVDRDREARPQVRRRGRDRRRAGRVPRDDHAAAPRPRAGSRSRAAATASSRSRGCASSRRSAAPGNEFVDAIVGGVIPRNFIPAVEKGVVETEEHGGALGFPVVDVKVTCFDGKHHPVDSSEMAFKTAAVDGAARRARQGRPGPARAGERARRRSCPRRARATSWATSTASAAASRVRRRSAAARSRSSRTCPTSEVLRYAIDLRSMTGGRGRFTISHSHYDPVPAHLVDKVVGATQGSRARLSPYVGSGAVAQQVADLRSAAPDRR